MSGTVPLLPYVPSWRGQREFPFFSAYLYLIPEDGDILLVERRI